jgi:very-short-patch-repair endonuclease
VVDFFCALAGIVVELDGRSHEGHGIVDDQRQEYLERQGLWVLRFTNDQVLANLNSVVETIVAVCARAQAQPKRQDTLTWPSGPPSPVKQEGASLL